MPRLPFIALERGYSRADTLILVLADLGRQDARLAPFHNYRFPAFSANARQAEVRRVARRFINAQICAHERAQEVAA